MKRAAQCLAHRKLSIKLTVVLSLSTRRTMPQSAKLAAVRKQLAPRGTVAAMGAHGKIRVWLCIVSTNEQVVMSSSRKTSPVIKTPFILLTDTVPAHLHFVSVNKPHHEIRPQNSFLKDAILSSDTRPEPCWPA